MKCLRRRNARRCWTALGNTACVNIEVVCFGGLVLSDQGKHRRRGSDILAFLDRHRLADTPDHFAFAHDYLVSDDAKLRARVDDAIDGGMRLNEDQIRKLRVVPAPENVAPQINHITIRVLDVVGDALATTGDLNRELVTASALLLEGQEIDMRAVVAAMVERTERAEASLADAAKRARDLRTELAALHDQDRLDNVTGLINRTAFEERLQGGSKPSHTCLALVDIDGLRRINEGYSHAVGDRLLKAVATILVENCGSHVIARWEGGTFAILAEDHDLVSTTSMLSNACRAVSQRKMKVRESDAPLGPITLSAGIAAMRNRTATATIEAAHGRLRQAKAEGRDRIMAETMLVDVSVPR